MNKQSGGQLLQQKLDAQTNSPVEPCETKAGTKLQDLNDDCLLEIFSKVHNIMDLCSIAEICERFRSINQSVRVIGKSFQVDVEEKFYVVESPKIFDCVSERSDAERIFKNFGSKMLDVNIMETKECFVFSLVGKHCEKLKNLLFRNLRLCAIFVQQLKPVLPRLQKLVLFRVSIGRTGNESIFSEVESLVELQMRFVENGIVILTHFFPKLDHFVYVQTVSASWNSCSKFIEADALSTFIVRHMTLKSLEIQLNRCHQRYWTNIFKAIGNSCVEVKKLKVGPGYIPKRLCHNFEALHALKSLTHLYLWGMNFQDLNGFAPLFMLRKLKLQECELPRDIEQFVCLDQLPILTLENCEFNGAFDAADIIRKLVNLEKVKLFFSRFDGIEFVLDAAICAKIDDIIKGRSKALTMKCEYETPLQKCMRNRYFHPNKRMRFFD